MRYFFCALACTIGLMTLWPDSVLSHEGVTTSITFDREISRILTRRCINCHSDDNLAFPLSTYEETRPWARSIEEEVLSRQMPPWRAVTGYGRFANDGALTTRELQVIVSWVEGNGPKTLDQKLIVGIDQSRTPASLRLRPDFDRWQLGPPDLVRRLSANGSPQHGVARSVVDVDKSARRIRAIEFRPGDRRGIRAVFFWLEATGQWLGSWTPWQGATTLPDGVAYRMPAGSRIVADVYYQDMPADVLLEGQLGLYYAPAEPPHCPADLLIRAEGTVPPHATNQKFEATTTLGEDTTMLALIPRLPAGAQSFEVRARTPGGAVDVLLLVRDVLHDWPTPYVLATPVRLPKGRQLSATVSYRNVGDTPSIGGVDLRVSAYLESCSQ